MTASAGAEATARVELVRQRSLALRGLGATFLVLALVEAALMSGSPAGPYAVLVLFPAVALLYAAVGLLAWSRRPDNRFGAIVVLAGLILIGAGLLNVGGDHTALVAVGLVLSLTPIAAIMHLLLAFPSGELGRVERVLVVTMYVGAIALQAPSYVFRPLPAPFDVFVLADTPMIVDSAIWLQNVLGGLLLVGAAVVMIRRLRGSEPAQRRTLGVVTAVGIVTVLFFPVSFHLFGALGLSAITLFVAQMTAIAIVPVTFVLAALRGGFARTSSLEELGVRLGSGPDTGPALRDGVAAALGDPTLQLLLRSDDGTGFVDSAGRPASPPPPGGSRGTVDVELHGSAVGAIVYDTALLPHPEVVSAAGRVLAIALDRERLIAELRSSREAVRESRARIVAAADRERRRVERNLHDGAQQLLTGLALLLHLARRRTADDPELDGLLAEADRELTGALAELRALARGLHPAILTDAGLAAALETLAERSAVPVQLRDCPTERLPEQVEVTVYYVVAEALANAAKHAEAGLVDVTAERRNGTVRVEVRDDGRGGARAFTGSGLEGLRDRVEAVGGRLRLDSPAGGGTRLEADLPCG